MECAKTIVTLQGYKITYDTRDLSVGLHLERHAEHEPHICNVFTSLVRRGHRVAILGSNYGIYDCIAAFLVGDGGHVWSFEANPYLIPFLEHNLEQNDLRRRVTVVNKAVHCYTGQITLHTWPDFQNLGGSSVKHEDKKTESFLAPCVTLDDYFGPDDWLDVLKMDIEGNEANAVAGMERMLAAGFPRVMVVEYIAEDKETALPYLERLSGLYSFMRIPFEKAPRPVEINLRDLEELPDAELVLVRK